MSGISSKTPIMILSKLPLVSYFPVPEIVSKLPTTVKEEEIWDILGLYIPRARIILLDDEKIQQHASLFSNILFSRLIEEKDTDKEFEEQQEISQHSSTKKPTICIKNAEKEHFTYTILRELVRLHEHVHALLHTSSIGLALADTMYDQFQFKLYVLATPSINTMSLYPSDKWYQSMPRIVNEAVTEYISYLIVSMLGNPYQVIFDLVEQKSPFRKYYNELKKILGETSSMSFISALILTIKYYQVLHFGNYMECIKNCNNMYCNKKLTCYRNCELQGWDAFISVLKHPTFTKKVRAIKDILIEGYLHRHEKPWKN